MTAQLPLALRWPRRQRFEHFHAGANAAAAAAVQALARDAGAPWVYLYGAPGSGRSHLLVAACQAAHAAGRVVQYLPLSTLGDRAAALRGVGGSELLALDDLGAIAGDRDAENALFDLYNRARAEDSALLFAADAARQLGARKVGLVAPYLCYMRQDRSFKPGEAVTSRSFAALLSRACDWLVTVDPHLHRYKSLSEIYAIPARALHAGPAIADWIGPMLPVHS